MTIDPDKVSAKIDYLDSLEERPGAWISADDVHALTKVDVTNESSPSFYPSSGIPVKVFMNVKTGEIRLFPASLFKLEEHE